jgi:hypothetical protein
MMYVSAGVSPEVSDVDGDYEVDTAEHVLVWHAGRVDASRRSGQLEFSVPSGGGCLFPGASIICITQELCTR